MSPAKTAILILFKPIRRGFLVLGGNVIAPLAFAASQRDDDPHGLNLIFSGKELNPTPGEHQ